VANLQERRIVCWAERAALFLLIVYLCVHTMPRAWNSLVTDFPNYYMSARLAHEGYDTSRMHEWEWLQREKDHRAIAIRVIGLLPITPFSTLFLWPLTGLAPLAAKHVWILLSLGLLIPIGWMLRSMTGLSYRRIALAFALSFPLYRNLQFGQFYVLLLLLIVAACWAYLRGLPVLSGALVGIAAACKIFPVLFLVFFLQRRAWRSLVSGLATGAAAAVLSVAVFGWNVHRTYLYEILPWTLHGEGMPPYVTNASISGILHRLFLSEPQWNPHPWHFSPLSYSLLLPLLQMLVLAPAILLIRRGDSTRGRILLEWSALLTASLAISTDPASYNFVLMVLPMCVLTAALLQRQRYRWLAILLFVYIGIGFPMPAPQGPMGLAILLYVPRLPLMLFMLAGIYGLLWHDRPAKTSARDWTHYAWGAAMVMSVIFTAGSTLLRERAVRREYAYRLPLETQGFLNADPRAVGKGVRYIAFTLGGYHLVTSDQDAVWTDPAPDSPDDDLSFTSGFGHLWVERGKSARSEIIDLRDPSHVVLDGARDPILSADAQSLAFVRDDHGRGQLMMRTAFQSNAATEVALTPPSLNVYEASFLSEREYAFSAVEGRQPPQIYLTDAMHANAPLALGVSRYPALSPNGRWMAYSHFEHGAWNLWVRDQKTGITRRIGDVPCNELQPAWEDDSKTLLYDTDCGRSLWFTAVARRTVIP
jgi:Glycosyltransferase family 87/WD40-like Beta Propeller Repeat